MTCGWPMYRQPYQQSFRYMCGLYQQSHGAKCKHNCMDGLVATRFLLGCIRQRLLTPTVRAKLEEKVRSIAEREKGFRHPDAALTTKQAALAAVRTKRQRAGENLGLAEGPDQYRAVAGVFEQLQRQEKALEVEVSQLPQRAGRAIDLDAEVATALAGLDRMGDLAAAASDLGAVGQLFRQLNARLLF